MGVVTKRQQKGHFITLQRAITKKVISLFLGEREIGRHRQVAALGDTNLSDATEDKQHVKTC